MAKSKDIKLSDNISLTFLGNEVINDKNFYRYEVNINNIKKIISLEKDASDYDYKLLINYILKLINENVEQDVFYISSNDILNFKDEEKSKQEVDASNSGGNYGSNGGYSSETEGSKYSDETKDLFNDIASNAGEFDGSNTELYKFDLDAFSEFRPSIAQLEFISTGELASARSSLGQASAYASTGGCSEAVSLIDELINRMNTDEIEDTVDAQVNFYYEVEAIELEQLQKDAQLNFEDYIANFDQSKYIISKEEYESGLRGILFGSYSSLADYQDALKSFNYQSLSAAGRMEFAESMAGIEFYSMTEAEKKALENNETGTIEFDTNLLSKLGLDSTNALLEIIGGFKSVADLQNYLDNDIDDKDARLAVNEYVNNLIDSRWFNDFTSTTEGKRAYYDYYVQTSKENPNFTTLYDEYNADINTNYIRNCMLYGNESLIIPELASRPMILRIINDETGIFENNFSYYANITDSEYITFCNEYYKENGRFPDGIINNDGTLQQKTYTLLGEQFLYEMDYHADEWKEDYNPDNKMYTAFSKQAKYDAQVRNNRGEFVKNYSLDGNAEEDWLILNGQIENKKRLEELKEKGCLSYDDSNEILRIIGNAENSNLLKRIKEVGINGLSDKEQKALETLLKNEGFNKNQMWNFSLKYSSTSYDNISNYIKSQNEDLFNEILELGYGNLDRKKQQEVNEMLKQAGFSNYEIYNYEANYNSNFAENVIQTAIATPLTASIAFAKGIASFVENCRDAGVTISNNNFWLLYKDSIDGKFKEEGILKQTKKYKEIHQKLYDEIMNTYIESGAYDRDYENFLNSNNLDDITIQYLITKGYDKDQIKIIDSKIKDLEEIKSWKSDPKDKESYDLQIKEQQALKEQYYKEAFLDSKIKELNLGDANASSQISAAIKYGIRTGDFSKLEEYKSDEQFISMANRQYEVMLDVAVDNVGNWVTQNIYSSDLYKEMEDSSLVKKDNFLGVCVDQIGNMAVPIALSIVIPQLGASLGATTTASASALAVTGKIASSSALWTSAFGGAAQEAFSKGANYGDAINYSILSATTELATEWMFGGIMGFGTGWFDNVARRAYDKTLEKLASKIIKNPKTRAIVEELVIRGMGEGVEEITTDIVTPLWRSWTLEKELSYLDILHRDVSAKSLFETFSIAFVTSLFFSGTSIKGQNNKLNQNIENLIRITENNQELSSALRNMSTELFINMIQNETSFSQSQIFSELIGNLREQMLSDPKLKEAINNANGELLKGIIQMDANNNITNMQSIIEKLFDSKLLENATVEDIKIIENVISNLVKSNTNITAEQIYQELLNSDSQLIADNFAQSQKLNETIKNFIKSFRENSFSHEFKDGSKIELSESLIAEISSLEQTLRTKSFEINNGELTIKNENKFRKLLEQTAKNKIANLKYQNKILKDKFNELNINDVDLIENALYFMDQDSNIMHYTNDNLIFEYNGKSINIPVNLAVVIANEINLSNYIQDGKIVFKSDEDMKLFVNKTFELAKEAIDNINKRIDATSNKTLEDFIDIINNRVNIQAEKNSIIINKTVLEDDVIAYDIIMKNEVQESDVASENDNGIRRKIIYTTEENLNNIFNEKGLVQDVIDLMNQNADTSNVYVNLTNEQIENIEKRIRKEQQERHTSNQIEQKETQANNNQGAIEERFETNENNSNNGSIENSNENVNTNENVVSENEARTKTKVEVRARENVNTNENVVSENEARTKTKVEVRARENVNTNENVVSGNETRTKTKVEVRARENVSTNENVVSENETRTKTKVEVRTRENVNTIRNATSAATVVMNTATNIPNKASVVVDGTVDTKTNNNALNTNESVNTNSTVNEVNQNQVLNQEESIQNDTKTDIIDNNESNPQETFESNEDIHIIDENAIRNAQNVIETNSKIEVLNVEEISQKSNGLLSSRSFNPNLSYEGFDYVVKPKTTFEQALKEIIENNNGANILIEISNTKELTLELIDKIPDNVKVRVTGDYTIDFMNSFKSQQASGNGTLRNVTYTKEQLKSIMNEIYEFEKGINPSWSDMEKARYAYDYLKNNLEYHDVKQIREFSSKEGMAGNNANRLARYDGLVNLIEKASTCQGFAATYQELLTRMGIESRIVSGNLNGEGQHVYNIVKIDGKTFIVDTVREMLEANSPGYFTGTGFNVENIMQYHAKSSYQELIKESILTQISENIDGIIEKGVYNNMNLEELSDFIKDNYSETQIPSNLKEFIRQVDEFKMDRVADEVEVNDIHIDEYTDNINEQQVSSVEVLQKAKEELAKLRGGARGVISKYLKANAVVLTTIADPKLGIGSTITYNMVAEQILNGEFVANNKAMELMKETTLKILTWGYGKEQKTQIRNQIKYIEQVRMDLIEQGIDLDVSRSKKILNTFNEKTKVVKDGIKNIYGNVKARFKNNIDEVIVNEVRISDELIDNRNQRVNELIDMSKNGTDIHNEYRIRTDKSLKEVQNNLANMYENNSNAIVLDSGGWTHIHMGANPNITLDNAIKIYIPIDEANANVVTKQVLDFLLENNIASRNKVGSHVKGDAFVLRIFDKSDAKRVINYINEQVKLNPITGREIPLTFKSGNVSIAMDGLTSYNQIATTLIDNFAKNNLGTDITGFKEFVHALNEQIINGDVDLFETMFKDQIKNLEENPYIENAELAKANIYEIIDIIDKALNNNMNSNKFIDYISEYQNTSKINEVIENIMHTNINNQNEIRPNIVKTFITNIQEKYKIVRSDIGKQFRIAKDNVNKFRIDLKEKLEIIHAENNHISSDTSNVNSELIKSQINSILEKYNNNIDFIKESIIKTLEYKNIPVTEENIRTNLEQVLNGNYNVITSKNGLREQVINAANNINYCNNELSRLSDTISANENNSIILNSGDMKLENIIRNPNNAYHDYVDINRNIRFDYVWSDIENYFNKNNYNNLKVQRWQSNNFLNFTIGQPVSSAFGNAIKMYIPINQTNASYIVKNVIEYLAKNNIASDNKIAIIQRSDAFVLRIFDVNKAYNVANWINSNFNLETTGSELPLCYKLGKISIAMDGRTSYNSVVTQLIQYYSNNNLQNLNQKGFKEFIKILKREVILNKNTDILETIFANNTFDDLKNRYISEYGYDIELAKANAYANLYEIIDILDANINGNMSTIDFFKYLNEYTKQSKVDTIISSLLNSDIHTAETLNQTLTDAVITNNTKSSLENAAKLIVNSNEYLFSALRYGKMEGYKLSDLLIQVLGMQQNGEVNLSNEMQFLIDTFKDNNGVITNEMIEAAKQALLYSQNEIANNFNLELTSILKNMGYERIMEKFNISEEVVLQQLSNLYNDLLRTYQQYGLTEEKLNTIFAKVKFRNLDEMKRIYQRSNVNLIGGVNIAGTSYVNLDSNMNARFEIFLENVYHECSHAIGRITQREINGYNINGIINEYFTDLQAKKAGGFLESEAYIPKLVNVLEQIERIIDPSCELFTQVYVEGNFQSLIEKLTEITKNEVLANKLAKEIVQMIETTHFNTLNAIQNNQVMMRNYYMNNAETFVEYLKQQLTNTSKITNHNIEDIEMIDESTYKNSQVEDATFSYDLNKENNQTTKQVYYSENVDKLTNLKVEYDSILNDLKIGKKSLFEKVEDAINRDINNINNYIQNNNLSNEESKLLTEKVYLRLAEKYWGNKDAMNLLSDIIPSEGDTLKETIASIGSRVSEIEFKLYEQSAEINRIENINDINVRIIGNSSPILYLRLKEFENAITRMPVNLKNILKTVEVKIYDIECFESSSASIDYFDSNKKMLKIYAGSINNELRFYEHGISTFTQIPSIEYETIVHELGHIIDSRLGNDNQSYTEINTKWIDAMKLDKQLNNKDSVTDYGKTEIAEDFAESIKLYYRHPPTFIKNFPNRARLVEECINDINMHSPSMNANNQNFYINNSIKQLLSSKNINIFDIINFDDTKSISKIKDEIFKFTASLEQQGVFIDSNIIDNLTYILDSYKTNNGSIYYKDVIGSDTYIISDNEVSFKVDNNENIILDVIDYLDKISNNERNNMFLSFYKNTARKINSYDKNYVDLMHKVLSRLDTNKTFSQYKTKYIDLYKDNNFGVKQDIIPKYLKDNNLKDRLINLVKKMYPNMDSININRLLRHMEVTQVTDEGMCSYAVVANMIYEKYYNKSNEFLIDFNYPMYINSALNSGELMTDLYAFSNNNILINDNIVSKTNDGQVSLSDRKISSMWNNLFNTTLINKYFNYKNINLELKEDILFDYYNYTNNENQLSTNLFDGIVSNITKSLESGKHIAIALENFDIVVDGFEQKINNSHVMSVVNILDNGILEVDSWGKKCYIDLKNATKSATQITISELSLNEK